jgi:hypothetical protein
MMDRLTEQLFFSFNHWVPGFVLDRNPGALSEKEQLENHIHTIEQTQGRDAAAAFRIKVEAAVRPLRMIDSNRL